MTTVKVSWKAADRVHSGHPWIFSSDVLDRGSAAPGDTVSVEDPRGRALGTAHYSSTSQICLRLLSQRAEPADRAFFLGRLRAAAAYRDRVVRGSEAFRLVHGEADLLPGLVIDRYGAYFVIQTLSQGMDRACDTIVECLEELFQPQAVVARNDAQVRSREALPLETRVAAGEAPERVTVRMNDLIWHADLRHGQKTGLFLDQRENYMAAARFARGRSALDCFTSTGGFALHLAGQHEEVEAVDSSEAALALAEANRTSNSIPNVRFRQADVFDLLAGHAAAGRRFSTIILDPPAFAKSRGTVEAALRGYKEINRRALELLDPGGLLITCSCSHHVSEALLLETIAAAALDAGRTLRVLDRRTQSLDHPILLTVAETHYLKCLILEVVG